MRKGGGGIATLNLHHLFECIKRKPATDHVKNVEDPPRRALRHWPGGSRVKANKHSAASCDYFKNKPTTRGQGISGISYTHSWQFGDLVFTRDLAMTLEGANDRNAILTLTTKDGRLVLMDGTRPAFQSVHTSKPPLREPVA